MYNPDDQGSTPLDSDTRATARAMGVHLAEWGVPVGMDGFQVVQVRGHTAETDTLGRGYDDEPDEAGKWLRENDPAGHAVKRRGGREKTKAAA